MDWKQRLADVDDDYLIGLSNKGIVKRAYKDKDECDARIGEQGEEVSVTLGAETVQIRYPLGESKCSCPSRSICRHVVLAILILRESCLKEGSGEQESPDTTGESVRSRDGSEEAAAAGSSEDPAERPKPAEGALEKEVQKLPSGRDALQKEINAYSLAALKRAMGTRQLLNFVNLAAAGIKPEVRYSSVISVRLPAEEFSEGVVVKLLSPLEYASCTCHKKELCVHKAAAVLWCQLASGVLTQEGLRMLGGGTEENSYDMARVKESAGQMKAFLEELLDAGLSRTSPDVLDTMERLAIISHNAGLARFEGYFRALFDSYDRYFKRKAVFKAEDLMVQLTRLYRRAELLLAAEDGGEVHGQAGEFRAEYLPAGNLDLIGIAMEHFENQAGYEGETVYFLEEHSRKWYTYTNARPMFYEPGKRRGNAEKSQAPWGLNLPLEDLLKVRFRLAGAKCDGRRRLSSSQDTKGEVTGERRLEISDVSDWYYRDFGELYRERIEKPGRWLKSPEEVRSGAELVYVQAQFCTKAEFSQTGQILTLPLYDKAGRELVVEVEYSRQEAGTIRYLEKISEKKNPCFLGKLYLRDGRMRMYPVDVWEAQ